MDDVYVGTFVSTAEEIQAVRRACFELVPTMAIQMCVVHVNGSLLKPEIIMQRLASIPICVDAENFVFKEECECVSFCGKCSLNGTIHQKGGVVMSDLISGATKRIPILRLSDDQELRLDWTALKGTGRQSAYHIPVSTVIARPTQKPNEFHLEIESIHYPAKLVLRKALDQLARYCDAIADSV